jgi:hypothetical protein
LSDRKTDPIATLKLTHPSPTVVGLLVGGGVMWREPRLQAVDPLEPDRQSFGMFGIVAGQTARLNIVQGARRPRRRSPVPSTWNS